MISSNCVVCDAVIPIHADLVHLIEKRKCDINVTICHPKEKVKKCNNILFEFNLISFV